MGTVGGQNDSNKSGDTAERSRKYAPAGGSGERVLSIEVIIDLGAYNLSSRGVGANVQLFSITSY